MLYFILVAKFFVITLRVHPSNNALVLSGLIFYLLMNRYSMISFLINWRASEASETLSGVYKFELVRYVYIYIYIYKIDYS